MGTREIANRAGSQTLALLAAPLNVVVLDALAVEPLSLTRLQQAAGLPPQTTMRKHLRTLAGLGVIKRHQQDSFPGAISYALTPCGGDLLAVADVLRGWLGTSPDSPIDLGTVASQSAIKALAEAWSTGMLRALSARALSLTELDQLISGLSYPSLERRLTALRMTGQVVRRRGDRRGTPHAVTNWLRRAVGPLAAAADWERAHAVEGAVPVGRQDAETALLLSLPLLRLGDGHGGSCRMVVELPSENKARVAGALAEFDRGRMTACSSRLQGGATSWISGPVPAWLRAVVKDDTGHLEIGGDGQLAEAILHGLQAILFAAEANSP